MKKLLTLGMIGLTMSLSAQINYVDIQPDYHQNFSADKSFDLDQDGSNDLTFSLTILDPQWDVWLTYSTMGDLEICTDPNDYGFMRQFTDSVFLDTSLEWKSGNDLAMAYLTTGAPEGRWPGVEDKYLAFRLKTNGEWLYGWMRLSMHPKVNSITIKDYAYEASPNEGIRTGQTKVDVRPTYLEESLPPSSPFHLRRTGTFYHVSSNHAEFTATLLSLNGQVMLEKSSATRLLEFNSESLPSGIYLLRLSGKSRSEVLRLAF
ncbi:T9SS type A sorting domain-containing protein [bacterium SCSIO 12741]|nr:T9SS type A sorting domain-containing protein [bacterium SCSIO 12741]